MAISPKRLRMARKSRGWTQVELAERAGVEQISISKYERGACEARHTTAIKVAAALGVSVEWLAGAGKERERRTVVSAFRHCADCDKVTLVWSDGGMTVSDQPPH